MQYCLHGDRVDQRKRSLLFGVGSRHHREAGFLGSCSLATTGVAHDGAETCQQRTEAVCHGAIFQSLAAKLLQRLG